MSFVVHRVHLLQIIHGMALKIKGNSNMFMISLMYCICLFVDTVASILFLYFNFYVVYLSVIILNGQFSMES